MVRLLGAGAFAAVYAATDPALDVTVAVKVLGDNHCSDPDIRSRFIREARLLRRIGTDRLVSVFDIGEQHGQPYFVMELIDGGTLATRMTRFGRADPATVRRIVWELSECLHAIHRAGVVHRDLKPSNVLVRRVDRESVIDSAASVIGSDEQLVLGDFGIARELDASNLTMAMGTEGFMAPEQRSPTVSIDHRADIYAATAIVAALVTGTTNPARSSQGAVDALPPRLRATLGHGMADDPGDRPSDAASWRDVMLGALADEDRGRDDAVGADRSRGRSKLVLGALAVVLSSAVAGSALMSSLGGRGPTIIGPDVVAIGSAVVYQAEAKPGAEYYWVDWDGVTHPGSALRVEPRGPGVLPISLVEVVDGEERTSKLVITVEG